MRDKYLTVTALTKYIKRKIDLDPHLKTVWLRGEISNFKHHSRGHMYLTIKDDQTRIQAVMFAGNNRFLKFLPENGMSVLIKGEISVYEAQGQYQLYIQEMEPDGIGSLYLAFEQLKEKLKAKGYFEDDHKKELPRFPTSIGVITSPTGAAVRDIITTIKRRYKLAKITVIPVLVQGEYAADSIKRGIEKANIVGDFDVLIVGRGGGSIEELWSFNEEVVAEAIFHSEIPIISAVGHETDTTISDFVADLRAPTPTGAAELAVPSQQELLDKLAHLKHNLNRNVNNLVNEQRRLYDRLAQSYAFRYPEQLLRQKEQELDRQNDRLEWLINHHMNTKKEKLTTTIARLFALHPNKQLLQSEEKLNRLIKLQQQLLNQLIEKKASETKQLMDKLTLLNPLEVMKRGFAIPYTPKGEIITTRSQIKKHDKISITIKDGQFDCEVLDVKEREYE
ncbi:exodeoxyribonuclease VII large subunit [Ornithinibacillus halophilus]|uniref:Exodeoxyribonuclease 7 large subunit n=1 Tax=Ornithinibacillus halophilus TaxID=930117 RepID=A0A1M5CYJ0_9BACI|nr:exodeoxyribonuclease VII large subunit [Ornithinibacillus halophilus]SHF59592.1 Exodeoxyribonuclease VII large subunit [Ornithinibacillus halophilus]